MAEIGVVPGGGAGAAVDAVVPFPLPPQAAIANRPNEKKALFIGQLNPKQEKCGAY
ncbi:MAG: hypothetical protein OEY72_00920 [Gammaproteobacteria bacterium]|nr:hypothetical protein [Gammaproteobacteria bacterium]